MTARRPIARADDLPRLRADAELAIAEYDKALGKAEGFFLDRFAHTLAPDLLRLIAVRFLEIADEREPAPVSGKAVARAYGWERRTFTVRDPHTLPTVHLVNYLAGVGWEPTHISDELAARRVSTVAGRVTWMPRVVASIAEREEGRERVWTDLGLLGVDQ